MGNRGVVDLAARKAQQAQAERTVSTLALLRWAESMRSWLSEPLDAHQVDERIITVAGTGARLIVSRRAADEA